MINVPQSPMRVEATNSFGADNVPYNVSANDDVDGATTPSCKPPSGSPFDIGNTTVSCTAKDKAGNSAGEKQFTIAVVAKPPPPPIEFTVYTDKPSYTIGEQVRVSGIISNQSAGGTVRVDVYNPEAIFQTNVQAPLSNNGTYSHAFDLRDLPDCRQDIISERKQSCAINGEYRVEATYDGRENNTEFNVTSVNTAPIANAGLDQEVDEGELVILDGSASRDPDNNDNITSYHWDTPLFFSETCPDVWKEGEAPIPLDILDNPDNVTSSFIAPNVPSDTELLRSHFELTVTDERGESDSDCTRITVEPRS